jgi:hypothetical protein
MDKPMKEPNRLKSVSRIGQMMLESFADIRRQAEEGKKVVWANGLPAFLLARGADVPILHAEGYIAGMAAKGLEKPLQESAEAFGLLPDGCSYARSFIGLARIATGDFQLDPSLDPEIYGLPKPDAARGDYGVIRWLPSVTYPRFIWNPASTGIRPTRNIM